MARPNNQYGRCKLCGVKKTLTFEHVPPSTTFNKTTRHKSITIDDLSQIESIDSFNPPGKILQGGIGYYALCKDCNNFLGKHYVPAFRDFAYSAEEAIIYNPLPQVLFCSIKREPLKIIKQIVSMFIVINDDSFGIENPELLNFVRNPSSQSLPERFKIYCYLKNSGQHRYCNLSVVSGPEIGIVVCSEIAFHPFGFILTLDHAGQLKPVADITSFKHLAIDEKVNMGLNLIKLDTHLPFPPLDYRSKSSIDHGIADSNKYKM